jgi:hypothetical protein
LAPLPSNINLLTLKQLDASNILLRLEHIFQTNQDPILSQPVSVDIAKLFTAYNIVEIKELNLPATLVNNTLSNIFCCI